MQAGGARPAMPIPLHRGDPPSNLQASTPLPLARCLVPRPPQRKTRHASGVSVSGASAGLPRRPRRALPQRAKRCISARAAPRPQRRLRVRICRCLNRTPPQSPAWPPSAGTLFWAAANVVIADLVSTATPLGRLQGHVQRRQWRTEDSERPLRDSRVPECL